jgi:hypothetical protein
LAHYVEHHHIVLPDEFVQRAISGNPPPSLSKASDPRAVDFEFWLDWTRKHSQRPFWKFWKS